VPVGNALQPGGQPPGQAAGRQGPHSLDRFRPVESIAPGVLKRHPGPSRADRPEGGRLQDPICRGQREYPEGAPPDGQKAIGVDTIINQKEKDCICIYVAVGLEQSTVANVITRLTRPGQWTTPLSFAHCHRPGAAALHRALRR
jgi:F-type H+-transporting ATPase subunit alpha